MRELLGPIRQVGYVVRDLDRAIEHWTRMLGVGPFFSMDRLPLSAYTYRGRGSDPHLSGALSYSGTLQIELLAVRDDAPSMWRTFLDEGHEGLHHVAYWTRHFDRDLTTLCDRGLQVAHAGRTGDPVSGGRFAYLQPCGDGSVIVELSETDDVKLAIFDRVAEAARAWDGTEPIRDLGHPATAGTT